MPKQKKHILVLANSIKNWPNTCVAGREVSINGDEQKLGPWIRPVSAHGKGEISPEESALDEIKQTEVFDFVEIQFEKKLDDPNQPENWLIDTDVGWRRVNRLYKCPQLKSLLDSPTSLWLQPDQPLRDRVSAEIIKDNPPNYSLRLIHVPSVSVFFGWKEYDDKISQQRKARFTYRDVEYEFGLTDPVFSQRYREQFPPQGQPPNTFEVTPKGGCYLCVSLTPEWENNHYKVVATILESNAA